jgi:hypothetical protein
MTALGPQFATALAEKDFDRVRALLHPEIDFRGMTPNRAWEGQDPDGLHTVEQQAYVEERDGRISWMRVLCSGFQPAQN